MAHAHSTSVPNECRHGQEARSVGRHEHHAHDRRASRAARHLHGRPPALAEGLDINLPAETQQAEQQQVDISQIVLEYTADRRISVNKQDVTVQDLESRLRTIFESRKDKTMFIAGAGTLRYGDIVEVIDAAKGAGVEKVGIVTEAMRRAAGATGTD
jgi:biopolymer transport protein ExbD